MDQRLREEVLRALNEARRALDRLEGLLLMMEELPPELRSFSQVNSGKSFSERVVGGWIAPDGTIVSRRRLDEPLPRQYH